MTLLSLEILFALEYFPPHTGGVETLFGQLAAGLVERGHRVRVVTSEQPGAPAREPARGVEIPRISLPRTGHRYFFSLLAIPPLLRLARTADLLHTTTYTAALPAWLAARRAGKPVVIT